MKVEKSNLELKVGAFVSVGLLILVAFILLIGDFKTLRSGYRLNFMFHFINGVKVGAPVRFAGVDVGEVKQIDLVADGDSTSVKVTVWIRKEIRIPSDSRVWVNTLGLLGEKYVEIMPGTNTSAAFEPDSVVKGNDPVAMHEVAEIARGFVNDIQEAINRMKRGEGTLGRLLFDDTLYREVDALVVDIRRNPWKLFWKTKEKSVRVPVEH
ncbi:MAG: MlaD family protein [Candidatus Omnitrophota bacterium]|jgi:phospholipid/cholesterol/gamma-HCH transport system substrate-binding protein